MNERACVSLMDVPQYSALVVVVVVVEEDGRMDSHVIFQSLVN